MQLVKAVLIQVGPLKPYLFQVVDLDLPHWETESCTILAGPRTARLLASLQLQTC